MSVLDHKFSWVDLSSVTETAPLPREGRIADFIARFSEAPVISRAQAPAYQLGVFEGGRKREHARARTGYAIDIEDMGDGVVPPRLEAVVERLKALGIQAVVHTTGKHCDASPRLRVIAFAERPVPLDSPDAVIVDGNVTLGLAVTLEVQWFTDRTKLVAEQLLFYPRREREDTVYQLEIIDGRLLNEDDLTAFRLKGLQQQSIIDEVEREREAANREARQDRERHASMNSSAGPIACFNATASIEDLLKQYGYKRRGKSWRSPQQTSDSFATDIHEDENGRHWVSFSGSDIAAGLGRTARSGTTCWGDAYDLFVFYEHGGNKAAALGAISAEWRRERDARRRREYQAEHQCHNDDSVPDFDAPGGDFGDAYGLASDGDEPHLDMHEVGGRECSDGYGAEARTGVGERAAFEIIMGSKIFYDPSQARALIPGLLPDRGAVVLAGEPGSKKSFVAIDWSVCIAAGRLWANLPVIQGRTLYIAAEGHGGIDKRIVAAFQRHGLTNEERDNFMLLKMAPNLGAANGDADNLIVAAKKVVLNGCINLIVIDTLAQTLGGEPENGEGMQAFVQNAQKLAVAFGCLVIAIHHPSKDGDSFRGHSSLLGAVDVGMVLKKGDDPLRATLKVVKSKEGEEGVGSISFKVASMGVNAQGSEETTLVVESASVGVQEAAEGEGAGTQSVADFGREVALADRVVLALDGNPLRGLREVAEAAGEVMSGESARNNASRRVKRVLERLLRKEGGTGPLVEVSNSLYRLTPKGRRHAKAVHEASQRPGRTNEPSPVAVPADEFEDDEGRWPPQSERL